MVSASFFAVALFASIAFVSASPAPAAVDARFNYIGTGNIRTGDIAPNAVQVNDLEAKNIANFLDVL